MGTLVVRTEKAAEMLGTSPNRIRELVMAGDIPAYRDGRNWSIPVRLLESYVITRAMKETERRRDGRK